MMESAAESSAPSLLLEPTLNTYYYVQRADETWHVAEVIQRREVGMDNEKKKEFYVHYKDCKEEGCGAMFSHVYHCSLLKLTVEWMNGSP